MTLLDARRANQALLDTAAQLVEEFDQIPAGRVLRCFSRAVGQVRRDGCPTARLAVEAEWLAREMLAGRLVIGAKGPESSPDTGPEMSPSTSPSVT